MAQFDPLEWEPNSPRDWEIRDPMRDLKALIPSNQMDSIIMFDAWRSLPPRYRQQVWREREIAAHLYALSRRWTSIPGIRTVGVGKRQVNDRRRLVGIVTFEGLFPPEVMLIYEQYELPRLISVDSVIPRSLLEGETIEVPLLIEYEPPPVPLGVGIVPPNQHVLLSNPPPTMTTSTLQAGDEIAQETPANFLVPGTLTAIVSRSADETPLLLSAAHVLGNPGSKVVARAPSTQCVGHVIESDDRLDAALAELKPPWRVDYRIKTIDLVPAAPVFPWNDLAVQFVGARSKHQQGWLDLT